MLRDKEIRPIIKPIMSALMIMAADQRSIGEMLVYLGKGINERGADKEFLFLVVGAIA